MRIERQTRFLRARAVAAAVTITLALGVSARAGSSRETGSLSGGRDGQRAFRLADGRVLVFAGGDEDRHARLNTETYDPATEQWSPSGDLSVARYASLSTMLSDGRVFVVGGQPLAGNPRIAEIFDPATGTWTQSGKMKRNRLGPSNLPTGAAVLLPDGRVLVAGGEAKKKTVQTYEIYDPSTRTFSRPKPLPMVALRLSLTRLHDGRVLAAGGFVYGGTGAEAFLYDSATNTWTPTGSRHETAGDHAAVLLPSGEVLAIRATFAELYDPSTGEWRRTGDLLSDRAGCPVVVTEDGLVLVISGNEHPPGGTLTANVEVYSPSTGTWFDGGTLLQGRYNASATPLLDGRVLVVGGRTADFTILPTAELYTP